MVSVRVRVSWERPELYTRVRVMVALTPAASTPFKASCIKGYEGRPIVVMDMEAVIVTIKVRACLQMQSRLVGTVAVLKAVLH